jgi:Glycosyl hydrolase 108
MDLNFLLNISDELDSVGYYKDAEILDGFIREAAKKRKFKPNWTNIGLTLSPLALGLLANRLHQSSPQQYPQEQNHPQQQITQVQKNPPKINFHLPKGSLDEFKKMLKVDEALISNRDKKSDPGGLTNRGIKQETYNDYRKNKKLKPQSVIKMTNEERNEIIKKSYWTNLHADELPKSIALVIADWRFLGQWKPRYLQEILGIPITHKMDKNTIASVWKYVDNDPNKEMQLANALANKRLDVLKNKLPQLHKRNRGWDNRIEREKNEIEKNTQESNEQIENLKRKYSE